MTNNELLLLHAEKLLQLANECKDPDFSDFAESVIDAVNRNDFETLSALWKECRDSVR